MAYYDISIERLQRLIDGLEDEARTLHVTNTVQTTKLAGLVRTGIASLVEARDLMLVSNYTRERDAEARRSQEERQRAMREAAAKRVAS